MESLRTDAFDYHLPEELIATHPPAQRSQSRMLVVDRASGSITHERFESFPNYLQTDDLCVLNNTRVMPARFYSTDGRKEILRLDFQDPLRWRCMVRPGKKLRLGHTVAIGEATGTVVEMLDNGDRLIQFDSEVNVAQHGQLALPHYMKREGGSDDWERYQTVYAQEAGAIAAPTAGLHFTKSLLDTIPHTFLTLHVGVGTFQPVREEEVSKHEMHSESYELTVATATEINQAKRTVAIGTTVVRVLEHLGKDGALKAARGETEIFIYPPYSFKVVDALLTNFHLPKSTLLMLVSALAGKELILEAYAKAVEERYRFFSYGDCMLIL